MEARCKFCGRTAEQVDHIIARQGGEAGICCECYKLCAEVIREAECRKG